MEGGVPDDGGEHLVLVVLPADAGGSVLDQFLGLVLNRHLALAVEDLVEEFPMGFGLALGGSYELGNGDCSNAADGHADPVEGLEFVLQPAFGGILSAFVVAAWVVVYIFWNLA
jgi:hypothetical protein